MSPSYDLVVTDMLYRKLVVGGPVMALKGDNVNVKVPDPDAFCKDKTVLKAVADSIAEKTGVKGAMAEVNKCTPFGTGRLDGRRLDTVERNVDLDITVTLPADQASQGSQALTNSLLSDVSDVVSTRTTNIMQILEVQTPQGILAGGGGSAGTVENGVARSIGSGGSASVGGGGGGAPLSGLGSMPGALGAAVQQGFRAAMHTHDLLGKYSRDWNLASQSSGVFLLATVLGIAVLIAAMVKQRWSGEQASDLALQGDALLAEDE